MRRSAIVFLRGWSHGAHGSTGDRAQREARRARATDVRPQDQLREVLHGPRAHRRRRRRVGLLDLIHSPFGVCAGVPPRKKQRRCNAVRGGTGLQKFFHLLILVVGGKELARDAGSHYFGMVLRNAMRVRNART